MADLTKEELEILTEQAKPGNGWGALISRDELRELLRVYLAVAAAPVFDMHLVHDDSGRCIAANFATHSDPGQRVRLVATSGGE